MDPLSSSRGTVGLAGPFGLLLLDEAGLLLPARQLFGVTGEPGNDIVVAVAVAAYLAAGPRITVDGVVLR